MSKRFFFSTEDNILIFPSPSDGAIWQFYIVSDFLVQNAGNIGFDLLFTFVTDLIECRFNFIRDLKLSETAKYANKEYEIKTILSSIETLDMAILIKLKTCLDRKSGFAKVDCVFLVGDKSKVVIGATHDFTIDYLLTKKSDIKWVVKQRLGGYTGLLEIACKDSGFIWWDIEYIELKVNALTSKPCHVKYPFDVRDAIIFFNSMLV